VGEPEIKKLIIESDAAPGSDDGGERAASLSEEEVPAGGGLGSMHPPPGKRSHLPRHRQSLIANAGGTLIDLGLRQPQLRRQREDQERDQRPARGLGIDAAGNGGERLDYCFGINLQARGHALAAPLGKGSPIGSTLPSGRITLT
jgi:hypothetical protein